MVTFIFLFSCQQGQDKKPTVEETQVESSQNSENEISDSIRAKLEQVNSAIRQNVNKAGLYLDRALLYSSVGDYGSAIADVERAKAIDSTSAEVYLTASKVYFQSGDIGMVNKSLEKGLKFNPESPDLLVELSQLFLYVRNNKKSMEYADLAIKYDIYNPKAYYLKGFNFLEMRDTSKAISSFQTAVEQDPEYLDAYLQLGLIYTQLNNPLALDYVENVLEIDPDHKEALYTYAMYAQTHDMYNEAIQTYTKLTKIYPDFREAHYNLGYIHMYYLQLYRQATIYFSDAIAVDPNYYQAYYNLGYSYELMGDIQNAEEEYRAALQVRPDYDLAAKGLTRIEELRNMDI